MRTQFRSKKMWQTLLTKENYNTLVTIQKPMRNKYSMEANIERFANLSRVNKVFYSVINLLILNFIVGKMHLAPQELLITYLQTLKNI